MYPSCGRASKVTQQGWGYLLLLLEILGNNNTIYHTLDNTVVPATPALAFLVFSQFPFCQGRILFDCTLKAILWKSCAWDKDSFQWMRGTCSLSSALRWIVSHDADEQAELSWRVSFEGVNLAPQWRLWREYIPWWYVEAVCCAYYAVQQEIVTSFETYPGSLLSIPWQTESILKDPLENS